MDVAPCQQDLHAYSSSWLLEQEFCWASWLVCYPGLLGHCRQIYFATKVMINFSFFQAGCAHTCVSSGQNIIFSQAGPSQGLCALSVLTGTTRVFKAVSLDVKEHKPLCVVPGAFLSSVLAFAQHSWYSSACPQSNCSPLQGTKWAWGNKFQCLGYCPALPHPSVWSSVKLQAVWIILEYVIDIEWSTASIFPLEVPKVFCIPNKIFVLVVSPLVYVNRETTSRKQSLTL